MGIIETTRNRLPWGPDIGAGFKANLNLLKNVVYLSMNADFCPQKTLERASTICTSCMSLVKFISLKTADGKPISFTTNCSLNSFTSRIPQEQYGFHPYAFEIGGIICMGVLSWEEGLKRVDRPDDKRVIEQVREKLGRSAKICTWIRQNLSCFSPSGYANVNERAVACPISKSYRHEYLCRLNYWFANFAQLNWAMW